MCHAYECTRETEKRPNNRTFSLVTPLGFEPRTNGLKGTKQQVISTDHKVSQGVYSSGSARVWGPDYVRRDHLLSRVTTPVGVTVGVAGLLQFLPIPTDLDSCRPFEVEQICAPVGAPNRISHRDHPAAHRCDYGRGSVSQCLERWKGLNNRSGVACAASVPRNRCAGGFLRFLQKGASGDRR